MGATKSITMAEQSNEVTAILSGLVVRIDHLGICVADIDAAAEPFTRLLGMPVSDREHVAAQNVDVGWLAIPDRGTRIELLQSVGNAGLDRFLAKRGNAMHHIAISVRDIHAAVARIAEAGMELIDKEPRPGAKGHLVAFLHPRAMSGILVELVQDAG